VDICFLLSLDLCQKYFLDHFVEQGLGGECRLPLGKVPESTKKQVAEKLKSHWEFEESL
jgi:hypothetical protein